MKITDINERASKGYDDKKEFTCVCCGKPVMLTKFASAKTAKCQECKDTKRPINPDLVPKSKPKQNMQYNSISNTKVLPCIKCGKPTEVSKFMSAAKVLCEDCKGDGNTHIMTSNIKVDVSKVNKDTMPHISDYNILPSNIANEKLRDITCPACGEKHMRILNILDYSPHGLIIHYQCNKCKLLVSVSEQCYFRCHTHKLGHMYDYSGHAIEGLINHITSSRLHGTLDKLYKVINEHNIKVEGIELPPYRYEEEKPVPVGFVIPEEDRWIKTIEDTIQFLEGKEDSEDIVKKLKELFKED